MRKKTHLLQIIFNRNRTLVAATRCVPCADLQLCWKSLHHSPYPSLPWVPAGRDRKGSCYSLEKLESSYCHWLFSSDL